VKKPTMQPLKDLPCLHVMAFNAVSAPALVGAAVAFRLDGELDADVEVVLTAKDKASLSRAVQLLGFSDTDESKFVAVGIANMKHLKVLERDKALYSKWATSEGNTQEDEEL
jgi:hypothetical protein